MVSLLLVLSVLVIVMLAIVQIGPTVLLRFMYYNVLFNSLHFLFHIFRTISYSLEKRLNSQINECILATR